MSALVAQQVVEAADRMRQAADNANGWMGHGWCCQAPTQPWQPCLKPGCIARAQRWSYYWAVAAAHEARQLLRLADVVGDTVAFSDGEDRAEAVLRAREQDGVA